MSCLALGLRPGRAGPCTRSTGGGTTWGGREAAAVGAEDSPVEPSPLRSRQLDQLGPVAASQTRPARGCVASTRVPSGLKGTEPATQVPDPPPLPSFNEHRLFPVAVSNTAREEAVPFLPFTVAMSNTPVGRGRGGASRGSEGQAGPNARPAPAPG